ncbi:hypothetical protein C2W64_01317 [Brevibacillus laterosporus]|nr:hypothetical protein C2W64_01317 [Brevibacillus laterosporus]
MEVVSAYILIIGHLISVRTGSSYPLVVAGFFYLESPI